MGKALSTLSSYATRPLRNYNVRERAHKIIDSDVPKVAPRHPSTVKLLKDQSRSNPQMLGELQRKDDTLLKHLKDVYVKSKESTQAGSLAKEDSSVKKRPLPERAELRPTFRNQTEDVEEFTEISAPVGKITLLDATRLLTEYQASEKLDSIQLAAIAEKYRLKSEVVQNILSYYSAMQLYVPGHPDFGQPAEAPSSSAVAWKRYLAMEDVAYKTLEKAKRERAAAAETKHRPNIEVEHKIKT